MYTPVAVLNFVAMEIVTQRKEDSISEEHFQFLEVKLN
jgi:hypothetical protein